MNLPSGLTTLALALLLGGCSLLGLEDEPLADEAFVESAEKIVVQGGGGSTDAPPTSDVDGAAAERALSTARSAWQRGDALTVVAVTNRALRAGAPVGVEEELRRLRAEARASLVAEEVVRATVQPEADAVERGAIVRVEIVLRNLAPAVLTIPRAEDGSSDALAVLDVVREDYDVQGHVRSNRSSVRVSLSRDLTIAPGAEARLPAELPAELTEFGHVGFSVLEVTGLFRPVVLRVGESEFFDALPLEPARVRVFLQNYEPLALDPLASLRKAILKRSPAHILTATELLPPRDRGAARELLTEARKKDPELDFVLAAALARLDLLDR